MSSKIYIQFSEFKKGVKIGQGISGTVYSGKYKDKDVAIKEIEIPNFGAKEFIKNFKNEVQLLM
jgi:serine/threonine protein kinase